MILTIRTDKPEAELGLFDGDQKIAYDTWLAHRELAETVNNRIEVLLQASMMEWSDITGIVFYEGPGSFTGLRIGASIANSLAYSLDVPAVNAASQAWISLGIKKLGNGDSEIVLPEYGADAYTTAPRK